MASLLQQTMLWRQPVGLSRLSASTIRLFSSTMAPRHVKRITMFKVPKAEDIQAVLKEYEILRKNAKKVSSPSSFFIPGVR